MEPLSDADLTAALAGLPAWSLAGDRGSIRRELRFADFATAFGFMTAVALEAQAMNHHPDWSNGYATVSITLATHTADGVTELDVELAGRIDRHAAASGAKDAPAADDGD